MGSSMLYTCLRRLSFAFSIKNCNGCCQIENGAVAR